MLLDLQQRHAPGPPPPALAAALRAALPALLVGYGGTLSAGDRALLRAMLLADRRLQAAGGPEGGDLTAGNDHVEGSSAGVPAPAGCQSARPAGRDAGASDAAAEAEAGSPAAEVGARLLGPLARVGFLWGGLAERALADSLLLPAGRPAADLAARRCARCPVIVANLPARLREGRLQVAKTLNPKPHLRASYPGDRLLSTRMAAGDFLSVSPRDSASSSAWPDSVWVGF